MRSNEYEAAFSAFLERHEYDKAAQAIYDLTSAAFLAGWKAAGGEMPQEERIFQLLPAKEDGSI